MAKQYNIEQVLAQKENWKQTRRKTAYTIYMCIPPVGTKIFNKMDGKELLHHKN